MFTIATLLFIGLLAGIYFKLGKHLEAKEKVKVYPKPTDSIIKECKEVQPKINKYIKKKVLCESKYKKRFV